MAFGGSFTGGIQGFGFNPAMMGGGQVQSFGSFALPPQGMSVQQFANTPMMMMQLTQTLQVMMSALQQLSSGYMGIMGGQQNPYQMGGFGGFPGMGGGFPGGGGGFPGMGGGGYGGGFPTFPFPQPQPVFPGYGGGFNNPTFGGGFNTQPFTTTVGDGSDHGQGPGFLDVNNVQGTGQPSQGFKDWVAAKNNGTSGTEITKAERTDVSKLNDDQRAVLHLWGRQVAAGGKNDGGIYFNVLQHPEQFSDAEVNLVRNAYNKEMQEYGGVTGKELDKQFFGLMEGMTGENVAAKFGNSPVSYAKGPVDMSIDATKKNGLGDFSNAVLRLWGHDRLDDGQNDGSILQFSIDNGGFDGDLNKDDLKALLAADGADGKVDGSSLASSFMGVLNQVYAGGPQVTAQNTLQQAGISTVQVGSILDKIKNGKIPSIPPNVDITDIKNIGKCPMLSSSVTQQGITINQDSIQSGGGGYTGR